jgi:formylglycine-generating enzyme required for sulfatase activity
MRKPLYSALIVGSTVALGWFAGQAFDEGPTLAGGAAAREQGQGGVTVAGNGDVNGDNGLDLSDAIYLLAFLFQGGLEPEPCPGGGGAGLGQGGVTVSGNGDVNGDNGLDLSDAIYLLAFLFQGGPAPEPCPDVIETACRDEVDDDGDGLTDCADDDCDADPFCQSVVMVCDPGSPAPDLTAVGFVFVRTNPITGCHEYDHIGVDAGGQVATGVRFVLLPGGEFQMGSPDTEPNRNPDNEGPVHAVTLDPFLISKTEVTQAKYATVMTGNTAGLSTTPNADQNPPTVGDDLPVGYVSWDDLMTVPDSFLARTGLRLPTEAQWEYAARGGTSTAFFFGDDCNADTKDPCATADLFMWWGGNSTDNRPLGETGPVGQKVPNAFGLFDMHGSVWEWCRDKFGAYTDPVNPGDGEHFPNAASPSSVYRPVRGGSVGSTASRCRSATRSTSNPAATAGGAGNDGFQFGFRLAAQISPDAEICIGGVDEDLDGLTDCDDDDCDADPFCQPVVMICDPGSPAPDLTAAGFSFVETNTTTGCHEYIHDLAPAGGGTVPSNIEFVLLPSGTFQMGSPEEEPNRDAGNEGPVHDVSLDPFLMAKTAVTQAQYEAVMTGNTAGLSTTPNITNNPACTLCLGDDVPVGYVAWDDLDDADGFLARTGLVLPTEAQWEYAARGGTSTAYSFGDHCNADTCIPCVIADNFMWWCASAPFAQRVSEKQPNGFGLFDMHGNVWEWVRDWFGAYTEPVNPGDGERQVVSPYKVRRGGSIDRFMSAASCRSANRSSAGPNGRASDVGFRVAAPAPSP